MAEYLNIPYSSSQDKFREFDIYAGSNTQPGPLICFFHGGAWRSEDKSVHCDLARRLASFTQFAVAVSNYRLTAAPSSDLRHPAHAEDVLQFLSFIIGWEGPNGLRLYDPKKLFLIGHSCSAHMLTSIFLNSASITPTLTPSSSLLEAVQGGGIAVSEGIYDIPLLLSAFPSYKEWFIAPTFGPSHSYAEFSTTPMPFWVPGLRWLIIHSKGDTLVDVAQSKAIIKHLRNLCEIAGFRSDNHVFSNLGELEEQHNAVLRSETYVRIVGDFILHSSGNKDCATAPK